MNQEMYEEAVRSNILSRQLIEELLNSLDYTGISFINSTIEVLKVIRTVWNVVTRSQMKYPGSHIPWTAFINLSKTIFLLIS